MFDFGKYILLLLSVKVNFHGGLVAKLNKIQNVKLLKIKWYVGLSTCNLGSNFFKNRTIDGEIQYIVKLHVHVL